MPDVTGNLPLFPGIFPGYAAPIVCNAPPQAKMTFPVFKLEALTPSSVTTSPVRW